MKHKLFKFKVFSGVLIIIFILGSLYSIRYIKSKPSYELKNTSVIENYTLPRNNNILSGNLYKVDVLFSGNVTSDIAEKYVENLEIPKDTVAVEVNFYDSYKDKEEEQSYDSLRFTIKNILSL